MPHDIFISYSSKDKEKADQLTELLASAGLSVWIDSKGLDVSASWSKEIVLAINECKAFIVLLSSSSIHSHNVIKEVSLASEKQKKILPVDLELVVLPDDLEYQLAGIHRVPLSKSDSIIRALGKIGVIPGYAVSETPIAHVHYKKKRRAGIITPVVILCILIGIYFVFAAKKKTIADPASIIKTIAVLPFENLSSDKENDYLADGLTAVLIDMLAPLQLMHVVDRKSSMEYKGVKRDSKTIASELGVRYLVDGTIRMQGKKISISIQMIDSSTGHIILTKTFDGTTSDLLSMQDQMARSIAYELQLTFKTSETLQWDELRSSVPEANTLFVLARGSGIETRTDILRAIGYFNRAIELDPDWATPYLLVSELYANTYYFITHSPHDRILADSLFDLGSRLDTAAIETHSTAAFFARLRGDTATALKEAKIYTSKRPEREQGYYLLAVIYYEMGKIDLAASNYEEAIKRNVLDLTDMIRLIDCLYSLGDSLRLNKYVKQALPLIDNALKRHPDRISIYQDQAILLALAGKRSEATRVQDYVISQSQDIPYTFYQAACVFSLCKDIPRAMAMLRRTYAAGNYSLHGLDDDPDLKNLRALPEFQEFVKEQKEKALIHG